MQKKLYEIQKKGTQAVYARRAADSEDVKVVSSLHTNSVTVRKCCSALIPSIWEELMEKNEKIQT